MNSARIWLSIIVAILCTQHVLSQDLIRAEYFYDADPGVGMGTQVSFTSGSTVSLTTNIPASGLDFGYHILSVRFMDQSGAWGITTSTPFFITANNWNILPLELSFPIVEAEYIFDADPGAGNGFPFFIPAGDFSSTSFSPNLSSLTPGVHSIGVRVRDQAFRWSHTQWQEIHVTNASANTPVASFSFSANPQAGNPVTFNSTSTNVDGNTLYQWDLDGDMISDYSGSSVNYIFPEPGCYPVSLVTINGNSSLVNEAELRYYFTGGSLSGAPGNPVLVPTSSPPAVSGRAGDMGGAYDLGPERLEFTGGNQSLDQFTVSFWFKGSDNNRGIRLIDPLDNVRLEIVDGYFVVHGGYYPQDACYGCGAEDGNWHHAAITFMPGVADGIRVFLDGVLQSVHNAGSPDAWILDRFVAGGLDEVTYSDGVFDDILIYDRALLDSEVTELFQETYASTVVQLVCAGPVQSTTISANGPLEFCEGGSVMLSGPAGTGYLWNTGETSQTISVSQSGWYNCTFTGADGNIYASENVEVIVNPVPPVSLVINHATNGQANGSAALLLPNGIGMSLTYAWSTGANTPIVSALAPGNYMVAVTDGTCPSLLNFSIDNIIVPPTGIVSAEYFIDSPDPGPGNGISIAIPEGNDVSSFADISTIGLDPGVHYLSVRTRDAQGEWGITRTLPFFLSEDDGGVTPDPQAELVAAEYFFDQNDPGPGNGIPMSPFNPGLTASISEDIDISSLSFGMHTISVRFMDSNGHWGMTSTSPFVIEYTLPESLPDILLPIVAAEYFIGEDPGPGNATPIEISQGTVLDISRTIDLSGYPAGEYVLSVRTQDITGQWSITRSSSFTLENLPCTVPQVSFASSAGNANETITLINTSSGVDLDATYQWDVLADGVVDQTTQDASYIFSQPGSYEVLLTVDNGDNCVSQVIQLVEVGPVLSDEIDIAGSLSFCEGSSVVLTAPAGSGYLWNTLETTQSIVVFEQGQYQCVFTDANGNNALTNSLWVEVYPAMNVSVSVNASTNGNANGSAGVFVSGGSSFSYDYLWSNGSVEPIIAGQFAGVYNLTVTDGVCPQNLNIEIPDQLVEPLQGIVYAEYFFDEDPGTGNGISIPVPEGNSISAFADVSTTGMTPGYHRLCVRTRDVYGVWGITRTIPVYLSDPNDTNTNTPGEDLVRGEYFFDQADPGPGQGIPLTAFASGNSVNLTDVSIDLNGLTSGFHSLSVRFMDAAGRWGMTRTSPFFIDVTLPPTLPDYQLPITLGEYFFDDVDPGVGNATAMEVEVGTNISFPSAVDVSSLTPGTHKISFRVRDLGGYWSVTRSQSFTIVIPPCPVPEPSFSWNDAVAGQQVNFVNSSVNVLPEVTYSWDFDGDGIADSNNANPSYTFNTPGTYQVVLTASNGSTDCQVSIVNNIVIGPLFSTLLSVSGPLEFCDGGNVILTAPNGTEYLWSDGQTSQSITVSATGYYQCSYLDPNGVLQASNSVYVNVIPVLSAELTINASTNGDANGSAGVLASGGSSYLYDYQWSGGQQTPIIAGVLSGVYSVTISDGVCPVTLPVTIPDVQVITDGNDIVYAEYFFDNDPGPGNASPVTIPVGSSITSFADIPTTGLTVGYHYLSVRMRDSEGRWGITRTLPVYINDGDVPSPPEPVAVINHAEYFFDNTDPGPGNGTPLNVLNPGTSISESFSINPNILGPGEHTISVRVRDESDKWSVTRTETFNLCNPPSAPILAMAPSATVCEGENLTLLVMDQGYNIIWTSPDGVTFHGNVWELVNIQSQQAGVYQVVAEGEPGCYSLPAYFTLIVETVPVVLSDITGPTELCSQSDVGVFFTSPVPNA
ncbi:MAG: hypothetical protein RL220_1840, partial [Bacteroidota bacterium]